MRLTWREKVALKTEALEESGKREFTLNKKAVTCLSVIVMQKQSYTKVIIT